MSKREQGKLDKLHKKEYKVKEAEQMAEMLASMVQNQRFVLEATFIQYYRSKLKWPQAGGRRYP